MYDPYMYPPDLQLAKLHRDCNQPGDDNPYGRVCPCCNIREKTPIKNWISRDIRNDFSHHGGAVVTYFSLLKFYALAMFVIICMYSAFQAICTRQACEAELRLDSQSKICVNPLGYFWVVSTQDLTQIMKRHADLKDKVTTLLVLRGVTFVLLLMVNLVSLYVVSNSRSLRITKEKPGIQHYTLFFKNINKSLTEDDLRQELSAIHKTINVREIFFLNKIHGYKKYYDQKLESYFKLQSKLKVRQRKKQQKRLHQALKKLKQKQNKLTDKTNRAIITFATIQDIRKIQQYYSLSFVEKLRTILDMRGADHMYVDPMPRPEEILWQYVGKQSHQKTQMKVLTFFVIIVWLSMSYLLLVKAVTISDLNFQNSLPILEQVWTTFLALVVVAFALSFRSLMNVLSVLRHPNTQSSKTMFIVSTTVIFHFIYFLIVPTVFFLRADKDQKSLQLYSVSYQALNFVIVQLIIAGFDIFYCCWASRSQKMLNNTDPGMCQKQLNQAVTAPRFPMEFKLIILFKSWSFVIFYAFEAPYIMLLIFVTLLFLLVNDRKNIYQHYRMQMIDYRVQRLFLAIYTNFFTTYMCIVFILTQNLTIELPIAIGLSVLAIILQVLFAISDRRDKIISTKTTLDQIHYQHSYKQIYSSYLKELSNPELDQKIEQYAIKVARNKSLMEPGDSASERLIT